MLFDFICIAVFCQIASMLMRMMLDPRPVAEIPAKSEPSITLSSNNPEDYAWINRMLTAAQIDATVEITCGCGFMSECAMHCNHERMPDLCPGDRYSPRSSVDRMSLS